jgi:glycosyltransferase involved in cell wall biosynthesis
VRIAYLSGAEIPAPTASALHVAKMCNALANEHHEVTCYAVRSSKTSESVASFYGIEQRFQMRAFRQSNLPGGGYRFAGKVVWDKFRGANVDAYYGRHPHALRAMSNFGKPFAFEAHAVPGDAANISRLQAMTRSPDCRAIVCISENLADDLRHMLAPFNNFRVLADAADPAPQDITPVSAWPGREAAIQIGYVGHIYPGKGMEMIWQLAQRLPEQDFHVVGGRDADIRHWQSKGSIKNLFFHGYVPHGRLPGYYAHLDVALLPLQSEVWIADKKTEIGRWTSPLKAFEYMSYGLPVVASNTDALREIFTHNSTALMVDAEDVQAWCEAIGTLISDPSLGENLGQQAKRQFLQKHTWAERAKAVVKILQ